MANIITSCRILFSIALIFFPVFSPAFYALYCFAGITDMVDGAVARKTNTVSEFGSRLDTAADIVFVAACLFKILPHLTMPVWLWVWVCAIAGIKVFNNIYGYIVQKKLVAEHTIISKVTGALLFVFPFTLSFINLNYSVSIVCTVATVAAVYEGYLTVTKKQDLQDK
ncbi:MAG: CDP-alcohol phosphatidyltransferase family protein [Oscillospiraceae bacterium]